MFVSVKNILLHLCIGVLLLFLSIQETPQETTLTNQNTRDTLIKRILESEDNEASHLETLLFDDISTDSVRLSTSILLGRSFYRSGNYKRSIPYFEKGIALSRKLKDRRTLKNVYLFLGNAHLGLWENEEALKSYYSALDIDKTEESKEYEVIIQPNVAIILRRMRQSEQALKVCQKSLEIIPKTKFFTKQNHVNIITITCDALIDLGEWEEVEKLALQGLTMSQDLGYIQGLIDIQTKLGAVSIQKGKYSDGEKHLEAARSLLDASGIESGGLKRNITYFTALRLYGQGKFQDAIDGLETIIAAYDKERPQNELRFIESFRLLAASYKALGNQEKSIYWYEQYTSLNDDYQIKKAAVVSSIYDRETAILDEQIELLENETLLSERSKWIAFIVLCIVLVCFGIYLWMYKKRQQNNTHHLEILTKKIEDLEVREDNIKDPQVIKESKEVCIDASTTAQILSGLSKLEAQEFYLKTDCNLRSMARKIKTNATYLSHTINHHRKQSFNEYINELRINYALDKIKNDRKFRSFSIKSIARELGYKSDYSFSKHFKRKTGRNPSQYIVHLRKLEE